MLMDSIASGCLSTLYTFGILYTLPLFYPYKAAAMSASHLYLSLSLSHIKHVYSHSAHSCGKNMHTGKYFRNARHEVHQNSSPILFGEWVDVARYVNFLQVCLYLVTSRNVFIYVACVIGGCWTEWWFMTFLMDCMLSSAIIPNWILKVNNHWNSRMDLVLCHSSYGNKSHHRTSTFYF